MKEPAKDADINALSEPMIPKIQAILKDLQGHGFDPVINETRRSTARQDWLYGQGRTPEECIKAGIAAANAHPGSIVTYTLQSEHIKGLAADIISRRRGWNWPEFFKALASSAHAHGLYTLGFEGCHVQWDKP
jgi:hypothetical protein